MAQLNIPESAEAVVFEVFQKAASLQMKQKEIAQAIGVSEQTISFWKRGAFLPTGNNLLKLMKLSRKL